MKVLRITWQRLVTEGQTCDRCYSTGIELEKAARDLKASLATMNIDVVVEKKEISFEEFQRSPLSSNQIWIDGKPLEEWLGGIVGYSTCCGPCGDSECRTIRVDGKSYETVTSELITRAGYLAASRLLS